MFLVPYAKVRLTTELSAPEVEERLRRALESQRELGGRIVSERFKIYRRMLTRNPYHPVVRGIVISQANGADISLRFFPNLILTGLFLGLIALTQYLTLKTESHFSFFPLAGFLSVHCACYFFGFLPERRSMERRLNELFLPVARA